ncbi:ABC transporter, partial [Achromatium sp. WMS1]
QEYNFNQFQLVGEIIVNQAGYYGIPRHQAWIWAKQFLTQLELWERRNLMARELSGGMKRRLMIARALVHQPKLLILDEPTAGVDIEIRRSMWILLRKINKLGTTIILTTHYLEEAESLCHNLAIIDQGRILEQSSIGAILNRLHSETFILDLRYPVTAPLMLPNYTITQPNDLTLEVTITKDYGLNQLFAALSQKGIKVTSMRNKQNRLEQLLMNQLAMGRITK